ncbi:hypothetical protein V2W45_316621 [Cenococcum geophilum]
MATRSPGQKTRKPVDYIEIASKRKQPERVVNTRGLHSTSDLPAGATSGSCGIAPLTKESRLGKTQTIESRQLQSGKQISNPTTAQEYEQRGSRITRSTGTIQNSGMLDEEDRPPTAVYLFKRTFDEVQAQSLTNVAFNGLSQPDGIHKFPSKNQTNTSHSSVTGQHSTNLQDAASQPEAAHKRSTQRASKRAVSDLTTSPQNAATKDKMVDTRADFTPPSSVHKDAATQEAASLQLELPTRSVPIDTLTVNHTVPLATAISTPPPFDLIYGEAEHQLHYFVSVSSRKSQIPSLRTYYRDLFINATTDLSDEIRVNLLIICLAYKTRDAILAFLSLINEDYSWAPVLAELVEEKGRDSTGLAGSVGQSIHTSKEARPSAATSNKADKTASKPAETAPAKSSLPIKSQTHAAHTPNRLPTSTKHPPQPRTQPAVLSPAPSTPPTPQARHPASPTTPFFILPTLPLAYPSLALYIWALFAPIPSLTLSTFLAHPSTPLLSLSAPLLARARADFAARWPSGRPGMQRLWTHLSAGREMLAGWAGQEVRASRGAGGFRDGGRRRVGGTGYAREEVEGWLEAFLWGRGEGVQLDGRGERERAKRVGWREELVRVRWIEGKVGEREGDAENDVEAEEEAETDTEADGDGDVVMAVG